MRATVGPLPPAVYWRRRAVVLGALLLGVLVLAFSCSGGGQVGPSGTDSQQTASNVNRALPQGTPNADPSFLDAGPAKAPALPPPSDAVTDADDGGPHGAPDVTTAGQCTDAEILVTPVSARAAVKQGTPIEFRLRIKNVASRTCARDVGADLQEVYIRQGARKVWSSDICGLAKGSDVQQFTANFEREYRVTWNGRAATKCANGTAIGPVPAAGEYQLVGRLGSKFSAPVRLVLVA